MRRSAAPSQIIGGEPFEKRPRFHPPFVGASSSSSEQVVITPCNSSSVGGETVQVSEVCHSVILPASHSSHKERVFFFQGTPHSKQKKFLVSHIL